MTLKQIVENHADMIVVVGFAAFTCIALFFSLVVCNTGNLAGSALILMIAMLLGAVTGLIVIATTPNGCYF